MKYLVTGLPRSRTAWTSVFLGCVMHPFNRMVPEDVIKLDNFSDPAFLLFWDKLYDGRKVVFIERDFYSCMDSAIATFGAGVIPIIEKMERKKLEMLDAVDCHLVDYNDYDGELLWKFVHGDGFDAERFKMLSEINMQTMMNAEIASEAISRIRRAA